MADLSVLEECDEALIQPDGSFLEECNALIQSWRSDLAQRTSFKHAPQNGCMELQLAQCASVKSARMVPPCDSVVKSEPGALVKSEFGAPVVHPMRVAATQLLKRYREESAAEKAKQVKIDASVNSEGKRKRHRIDIVVAKRLQDAGMWLNQDGKRIGSVPGVEVGDVFYSRAEMRMVGLHGLPQAGIDTMVNMFLNCRVAVAVVTVMHTREYTDDFDMADKIVYCGQGGVSHKPVLERYMLDQSKVAGNLALENSFKHNIPVRVIRGYKGKEASNTPFKVLYSYDGLYIIKNMRYETGRQGNKVFKFEMERMKNQKPLTLLSSPSVPLLTGQTTASQPVSLTGPPPPQICYPPWSAQARPRPPVYFAPWSAQALLNTVSTSASAPFYPLGTKELTDGNENESCGAMNASNEESDENPEQFVGRVVRKYFQGYGYFKGVVVKYNHRKRYFRVKYEDGDREELELYELKEVLVEERPRESDPEESNGEQPLSSEIKDIPVECYQNFDLSKVKGEQSPSSEVTDIWNPPGVPQPMQDIPGTCDLQPSSKITNVVNNMKNTLLQIPALVEVAKNIPRFLNLH